MTMPFEEMLPFAGIAVDVILIALVGALLLRLSKDPTQIWAERERRLAELHDSLTLLVRQADGQARALDTELSGHTDRLRGLLEQASIVRATMREPAQSTRREAESFTPRAAEAPMAPMAADEPIVTNHRPLREQVAKLSHSGIEVEEIARRLEVPLADVRVLVALEESARARARAARAGGQE